MTEIERARATARDRASANSRTFYRGFDRDVARWSLETDDQNFLRIITKSSISDRLLLSNESVHLAAQYALIDALLEEWQLYPQRSWLWVTLAWDRCVTWERNPSIDTISLRRIADRHLRRLGLHGLGVLEIDVWKNLTGEPGRRLVPHVHFIGYPAADDLISAPAVQRELCGRRGLLNSLDAPSAVVRQVGPRGMDFAQIAQYMLKRPTAAKNLVPDLGGIMIPVSETGRHGWIEPYRLILGTVWLLRVR